MSISLYSLRFHRKYYLLVYTVAIETTNSLYTNMAAVFHFLRILKRDDITLKSSVLQYVLCMCNELSCVESSKCPTSLCVCPNMEDLLRAQWILNHVVCVFDYNNMSKLAFLIS